MNNSLTINPSFSIKYIFPLNWRLILRIFLVLTFLSISALLFFYIFQVNAEVSERYLIQKYNGELSQILKENQNFEISLVQSNSLDNIITLMEELNFEKANKIHYIRVLGNQVVTTK